MGELFVIQSGDAVNVALPGEDEAQDAIFEGIGTEDGEGTPTLILRSGSEQIAYPLDELRIEPDGGTEPNEAGRVRWAGAQATGREPAHRLPASAHRSLPPLGVQSLSTSRSARASRSEGRVSKASAIRQTVFSVGLARHAHADCALRLRVADGRGG